MGQSIYHEEAYSVYDKVVQAAKKIEIEFDMYLI